MVSKIYYERISTVHLWCLVKKRMKKNLVNSSITHAFRAPKLPALNAANRANLFSCLITTKECIDKLLEQNPENEVALNIQCAFEVAVSTLLDGSGTIEEYLARDTKVMHTNIGGFIVSEENGIASFVCPACNMQTSFPATDENMTCIRESCVPDCCPVCNSEETPLSEKFRNIIYGG